MIPATGKKVFSTTLQVRLFHSSRMTKDLAVILGASRTPIGSFNGALSSVKATELGRAAVESVLAKSGVSAEDVDEVLMGNVCSAGTGQAPARQVALSAGLPVSVPCTTLNKVCASGMKTTMLAAQSITAGQNSVVVSGGFESMSNVPYYLPKVRQGLGYGHSVAQDGLLKDGLWDPFDDHHMGMCAERCAQDYSISREDQDAFAVESYRRAAQAWEDRLFDAEIAPVTLKTRKGEAVVDTDEEYSNVKVEKIPTLRPAFMKEGGTVTAANASSLNDGAAALIVASAAFAAEKGVQPIARVLGFADAAKAPIEFTTAPADAIPKAIANAGLTQADIDFWEINEAFSVVSLANNQLLSLDPSTVNINGGAVALGHPIGCSGARIIVTLLHVLQQQKARYGVAAICNGGGGASAIVVENLA